LIPSLTLFDVEARKAHASDQQRDQLLAKMVDEV
jgi:hypothetical protein